MCIFLEAKGHVVHVCPGGLSPGRTSLLSRMALLLVQSLPDRPAPDSRSRGNVALNGSGRTADAPRLAAEPSCPVLDGDEGMERAKGGDMGPCRLWRAVRVCAALWLPYSNSLEICAKQCEREITVLIFSLCTWYLFRCVLHREPTLVTE